MNATVIGVRLTENKEKNTVATTVYYSTPFSAYETESAKEIYGLKVGSEYIRGEVKTVPGDEVIFAYERGFGDKAVCTGLQVVKPVKPVKS